MTATDEDTAIPPSASRRIAAACAIAAAYALATYGLIEYSGRDGALISFTFLLILPAVLTAFIAYVSDPLAMRPLRSYMMIPVWLMIIVIGVSAIVLREGVICIVMLTPLWLSSSLLGAYLTHRFRRRIENSRTFCSALLVLPVLAMQVEPLLPLPDQEYAVRREVIVAAPPAAIWPLLRGIPDVHPGEGAWNVSQDLIGLPRPLGASLDADGLGAIRHANWGERIRFREVITQWQPQRAIGWRFVFDELDGWRFTDRHLMPNSRYFHVTTGGYRMEALGPAHTRLVLETRYRAATPVNVYAALWGELFLGDLETNLLALVRGRAEAKPRT